MGTSANSSSVYIVSQLSPLLMSDKVFMTFRVDRSKCFLFNRDRPFHRDTFTKPWISSWLDLVGELEIYVNHFHPGGLKWNIYRGGGGGGGQTEIKLTIEENL